MSSSEWNHKYNEEKQGWCYIIYIIKRNTFVQNQNRSSERLLYNPDTKFSKYSLFLWHKIF